MATAEDLRAEFCAFMRDNNVKYTIHDEADNIVKLEFAARPSKGKGADTTVLVDFDEKGDNADSVHFVAWEFASCTQANYAQVLVKLNDYNRKYRWCKFWMKQTDNGGGVITADADAKLVPGSSGLEVTGLAFTVSDIVEDAIIDLGDLVDAGGAGPSMDDILALLKMLADRSE